MDDLISRQAAIDALGDEPEVWSGKDEYEQGLNNQWHYDVNALKAVPSAERHGKWIIDRKFGNDVMSNEQMVICSVCGKGIFFGKQNYCPNCGAKMDEVDKDE